MSIKLWKLEEQIKNKEQSENTQQETDTQTEESEEQNKNREENENMFSQMAKKSNRKHYNNVENKLENLDEAEVPDSVINMLIDKFFNQTFSKKADLNKKQDAYKEDNGDLVWNVTELIKDKVTKNLNKMKLDKHGYKKESGERRKHTIIILF